MDKLFQLSVIASIFLSIYAMPNSRPRYVGCLDSKECGKGSCCTIGKGRYSIPQCREMLDLGQNCISGIKEQKYLELSYPDNSTIHLTNFYYFLCPCGSHMICSQETGKCEDPSIHVSFNSIDYY